MKHLIFWIAIIALVWPRTAYAQSSTPTPDPKQQVADLLQKGTDQFNAKQYQSSLDLFTQALPLTRQVKDRQSEAYCLYFIGADNFELQNYTAALENYRASQPIWHDLGDKMWESVLWNGIAIVYNHLQQYDQAIPANLKLLDLTVALGDDKRQAQTLYSLALDYDLTNDYSNAIQYYQELLALQQKSGDQAGEAKTFYNIGVDQAYLDQNDSSLKNLQQALDLYQKLGDQSGQELTLIETGAVLYLQGSYHDSIQAYQQGLTLAQSLGDRATTLECMISIGLNNVRLADYATGIKYYADSLALAKDLDDQYSQGTILNNLGLVYHYYLGDLKTAIPYYQQALDLAQTTADSGLEGLVLTNLATAYLDQNDYQQALTYYQNGLAAIKKTSSLHGVGSTLADIGLVYQYLGQFDQALDYYQQALTAHRNAGDRRNESYVLENIGMNNLDQGDQTKALDYLQQALAIQTELEDRSAEWETLRDIGYTYQKMGNIEQAITFYKQSIDIAESIQNQTKIEEFKSLIASTHASVYQELIDLLWNQGQYDQAFAYVERARARAFLDQLANGSIDIRAGAPSQLLDREKTLRAQIDAEREQLVTLRNDTTSSSRNTDALTTVSDQLSSLESEYSALLTEMNISSPETASLVSVNPASLQDIQKSLPSQTTLVEYFVTDERTFIFVITPQSFKEAFVTVKSDDLANAITTFRSFADLSNSYPDSLKKLYAWLIAPIQSDLNTPLVGIIPHGVLHYLPFAALTDGKSYFGEMYTLFTLPSASSLRFLHTKPLQQPATLLAMGNPTTPESLPDLHYAADEVKSIAALFKTPPLIGAGATKAAFLAQAGQATYIHLAAHGQYDATNPLFSTIFLAGSSQDDGRLEAHDIYSLDLTSHTDMVVLSACQTEIGQITEGDEVIGLTRAFLYAGTPSVIASLWNVDDAATSLLMEKFYQHLLSGDSKASALRQAQADVRQKYPNPYYWAAFGLTGDPGKGKNPSGSLLGINADNIGLVVYYVYFSLVLLLALGGLLAIMLWLWKPAQVHRA